MNFSNLHLADYIVIGIYLGATLALGVWFHGRQKNTRDYFFGGGMLRWWAIAISLFATVFSAISFIAMPGEAYNFGLTMFLGLPITVLALPVGLYIFLRFFYELGIQTCNEYLELRFSPVIRLISSLSFLVLRGVYIGVVLYASALVLRTVVGWPAVISILLVGIFSLVFAYSGGMASVVWTDVAQFFVLLGGLLLLIGVIAMAVPGGLAGIWEIAAANGRTFNVSAESGFWGFDPNTRIVIWYWLIGLPLATFGYATDQIQLQRALSCRNFFDITRTIWGYAIGGLPVFFLFYFAGLAVFAYFKTVGAEVLPVGADGDTAFNYFITRGLPIGLRGLLISGILAAVISTVDSVLNSLSTVFVHDVYARVLAPRRNTEHYLKIARISTLLFGILAIMLGVGIVAVFDGGDYPLIEVSNVCLGLFGSFTGGFFVLGLLSRRANSGGVICGMVLAALFGCYVTFFHYLGKPPQERVSFMLISLGPTLTAIFGGWLASCFFSAPSEKKRNFVVWGMFSRIRSGSLGRGNIGCGDRK